MALPFNQGKSFHEKARQGLSYLYLSLPPWHKSGFSEIGPGKWRAPAPNGLLQQGPSIGNSLECASPLGAILSVRYVTERLCKRGFDLYALNAKGSHRYLLRDSGFKRFSEGIQRTFCPAGTSKP